MVHIFFLVYPVKAHSASWICCVNFTKFGKFLDIISSNTLSASTLSPFLLGLQWYDSYQEFLGSFITIPQILRLNSCFFSLFSPFFVQSGFILLNSSSSGILSPLISTLQLSPSIKVFKKFSVILLFKLKIFIKADSLGL